MSRARARFTESDVRRVLSAARKAAVNVRVVISADGRMVVVTAPSSEAVNASNPWDKVLESAAPEQKRVT